MKGGRARGWEMNAKSVRAAGRRIRWRVFELTDKTPGLALADIMKVSLHLYF